MSTIAELLLNRVGDERPALLWQDRVWSWDEYVAASATRAEQLRELHDQARPFHVGLLLSNEPEFIFQLGAAGLAGYVVVGLNTTRRGAGLVADIHKADVQLLITDAAHYPLLDGLELDGVTVLTADETLQSTQQLPPLAAELKSAEVSLPTAPADLSGESLFMLIFTSGTSGDPKAVRVTHSKVTYPGEFLADKLGLDETDVLYVSMPFFHSNAIMAGWGPSLVTGAAMAVAKFSASRFIDDVRHYGATYADYVGKPLAYILATPPRDDDADNPLRLVYGNEASQQDIAAFSQRFDCQVVDGFGSTENAVVVSRDADTPPAALGRPGPGVKILNPETGAECPPAVFDATGAVINLDEATGELVNTTGAGQFAGYYNDDEATAERMRDGMYWSGDLAYADAEGWVYFAGRSADWLRVDGENLAAAPIERIILRHPAVRQAAVYAVPDANTGDQLAVAMITTAPITAAEWEEFLAQQADLSPKAWPRYVRIVDDLPRTATNKIIKRELITQGLSAGVTWTRDERGTSYH